MYRGHRINMNYIADYGLCGLVAVVGRLHTSNRILCTVNVPSTNSTKVTQLIASNLINEATCTTGQVAAQSQLRTYVHAYPIPHARTNTPLGRVLGIVNKVTHG